MKKEKQQFMILMGAIIQIILIVPAILFVWRFIVRKIIHPNPIRKYRAKNSYALITGASKGIGKSFAERLAKEGFNLILLARSEEALKEIKEYIQKTYNVDVIIKVTDLGKMDEKTVKEIEELIENNNVSVLINNAGVALGNHFEKLKEEEIMNQIQVNIEAVSTMTHVFIKHSMKNRKNLIVFLSSSTSKNTAPYNSIYSSTKAYIRQFGRSISYEYPNIDCTVFCPWYIATDMIGSREVKLGVASPDEFVDSAMIHVGLTNDIDPFIPHYFNDWFWDRYPTSRQEALTKKTYDELRKRMHGN